MENDRIYGMGMYSLGPYIGMMPPLLACWSGGP